MSHMGRNNRDGAVERDLAIVAKGVSKVYEPYPRAMRLLLRSPVASSVHALSDINLTVEPGSVCVVVGPNGAGKSTLFRILTGLTTATHGDVRIGGLDVEQQGARVRRLIGFAPAEERTLLLRHTPRENLRFHASMQGMRGDVEREINETLDMVGLGEVRDSAVVSFSTGMRARLQVARALVHRPRVLILDEPTSAIDPVSAREIITMILSIARDRDTATLISSHRLEEIEALRDRVLLIDRGREVYSGDLDVLRSQWTRPAAVLTLGREAAAEHALRQLTGSGFAATRTGRSVTVQLDSDHTTGHAIEKLQGSVLEIESVTPQVPTLLEVLERVAAGRDTA